MPHIFISYSQVDSDFSAVLMMELEKAGFDTWIDKTRLRPGADWSDEIDKGIRSSFVIVVVMSPESRTSEYVTYEWSHAIGAGISVIPIILRDVEMHPRLARLQHLDFTSERPWQRLIKAVTAIHVERDHNWSPPADMPSNLRRAWNDLDSSDKGIRTTALEVLVSAEHPAATNALRAALSHGFEDVRFRAAVVLGLKADEAVRSERVIHMLIRNRFEKRSWGSSEISSDVKQVLKTFGEDAYPQLIDAAKQALSEGGSLVSLAAEIHGRASIPDLIELLKTRSAAVQCEAITQLTRFAAKDAIGPVLKVAFAETSASSSAQNAILQLGDESIATQLLEGLKHGEPATRMFTIAALAKFGGESSVDAIAQHLSDEGSTFRYGPQRNIGMGIMHSDKLVDRTVAGEAATALKSIGTPKALQLLGEHGAIAE